MNYIDRTFLPRIDLARERDFAVGVLAVRPSRREVEAEGVRCVLQRRVMQVLVALAHPSAEVVSQDELISRCWGGLAVGEDAVGRCIGQLRRVAAGWAEPPFEIVTIAGVGYRLSPAPASAPEAASQPAPQARPAPEPGLAAPEASVPAEAAPPRRQRDRRVMVLAGGALALALAAGAAGVVLTRSPPGFRVVVAPFQSLSDGPAARHLADAAGDQLLSVLGSNQVEALSSADAGLKDPSSAEEAARRGVGLILDGSAQDDGKGARVVVRLVDARSRVSLWSAQFDKAPGSAEDLPAEVAARTADIVAIAQFARTAAHPVKDDAALSALLGAHDLVRSDESHNWARHVELSQEVVQGAPDFAFGHAMLALAYTYATRWDTMPQQKPQFIALARSEAAKALALDPQDAGAYFALSLLERGYAEREAVVTKGLSMNGHPAAPLGALNNNEGQLLESVGRLRDALPFIQRSVALDPLSPVKIATEVDAYARVGRDGEARDLLAASLGRWPNHPELRFARLYFLAFSDHPEAALPLLDDPSAAVGMRPETLQAWRDFLTAMRAGQPSLKARTAGSLAALADRGVLERQIAAQMLARLGAADLAFDQIDRMAGVIGDPRFLFGPATAALRRDLRFMPLAAKLGLVGYWRASGKWPDFCAEPGLPYDCRKEADRG